ncbi:MAG: methylated-DNA--[protein]-cysteine S-methyltransferase [Gammaproteobacteria bacterium]|nr:MAG: methylated-DNA--[protein]-cysteine S-methyltransferase [Gammaproteobacteria bacterium]
MAIRKKQYQEIIRTPFGNLGIIVEDDFLMGIDFLGQKTAIVRGGALAKKIATEINRYLCDPGYRFSIPYRLSGTAFQNRVWRALLEIPPGELLSYGELAAKLKTGARAVGNACRRNPIPVIVPCHRVTAKQGPGGYMGKMQGDGVRMKQWLIAHEHG